MRRRVPLIIAVLLFAALAHADTLLDSFDGADGSPGGNWNNGYGNSSRECSVSGNKIQPGTPGTSCVMTWAPNTYTGDQTAIATISALVFGTIDSTIVSTLLRASSPNTRTYYRCAAINPISGDSTIIWKVESGTSTVLNSNATETWVASDVLKCDITGTDPVTITVYRNGASILTASDSGAGILSGNLIGLSIYAPENPADAQADDFTTADVTPPAPTASNIMVITVQ